MKGVAKQKSKKGKGNVNKENVNIEEECDVCYMCKLVFPEGVSAENANWIECDQCGRWFHQVCVGQEEEEVMEESYFVCVNCCE